MTIQLIDIHKRFHQFVALDRVNLEIQSGELLALLGPSGSGKTTLLRILAGLEQPDGGSVLIDGEEAISQSPRHRQVGFVFQHYALFRHMTVFKNVAFGLEVRPKALRPPAAEIRRRVNALLELVQLSQLGDRYPNQLSGGQRQRIALARALAIEPKFLLLDEPFGALDAKVRKELRRWLRRLHDEMQLTSVFVTHDQEEALELADRVVVMSHGRIEQVGTPTEVYDQPATAFVYDFLGQINRVPCKISGGQAQLLGFVADIAVDLPDGPGVAFVRPHDLDLQRDADGTGIIRHIHVIGPTVRIELDIGEQPLEIALDRERLSQLQLAHHDRCRVTVRAAQVFPLDQAL